MRTHRTPREPYRSADAHQGLPESSRPFGVHRSSGLTDPAVLQAYVEQRVADPSLLSSASGPSYADFFVTPEP